MQDPNLLFDVALLLSHVQQRQEEANRVAAQNAAFSGESFEREFEFGHPSPPELSMHMIRDELSKEQALLVVAHTKHCVSAQILPPAEIHNNSSNDGNNYDRVCDPILVCTLGKDRHIQQQQQQEQLQQLQGSLKGEKISCLKIVELDDLKFVIRDDYEEKQENEDIDNKSSPSFHRVAIVLGTNRSRVLSVELRINEVTKEILLAPPNIPKTDQIIFEPFQLDNKTFFPSGGVTNLSTYCIGTEINKSKIPTKKVSQIWIAYGDGTIVKAHHAAFFPSVMCARDRVVKPVDRESDESAVLNFAVQNSLVKCQVQLPQVKDGQVIPLPKYHPSPLAALGPIKLPNLEDPRVLISDESKVDDGREEIIPEFYEALFYATGGGPSSSGSDGFPTFLFFTSEDQFDRASSTGGADQTLQKASSTSAAANNVLFSTVLGAVGAVGFLWRGFGGSGDSVIDTKKDQPVVVEGDGDCEKEDKDENSIQQHLFPALRCDPVRLFAGFEMYDSPRRLEFCTIDPDGNFAAATDGLGRVLLIDLSTKHIIRIFKGFRESTCCWLQVAAPTNYNPTQKVLFLVIHSRQRNVVEVWRVRHGPRVKTIQVSRDARVISCNERVNAFDGYLSTCYILHSSVPATEYNHIEKIVIENEEVMASNTAVKGDDATTGARNDSTINKRYAKSKLSKEAALRLQRLLQLLANTNVPCNAKDIEKALTDITSLKDLATALDRLSVATVLELKMGVRGADFQKIALRHCRDTLDKAVADAKDKDSTSNPNVILLGNKIQYHSQVVNAFEILHKFETGRNEDEDQKGSPRSPWIAEAVGWLSTYETINSQTTKALDTDAIQTKTGSIKFASFANCCENCSVSKNENISMEKRDDTLQIYFSDSSKTRRDVLVHIFKPLMGDIFAFNVVNSIFDTLGIKQDVEYLLKCFGEWFMTLPAKEALEKGLFALYSPMMRWLQELATLQFENNAFDEHEIALRTLHDFCETSEDLVRAFMLGTLCREAVASAATQKEQTTYGKITSSTAVKGWNRLLRKLRLCLLVSLRLHSYRIGTFPITVHNVDQDDFFSVYEWLAHDELAMSHKHEEIVSLEEACKMSGYIFDPSTEAGDDPARLRMLQNSCLAACISEAERVEYLVDIDDDDRLGPLLLYLSHYNEPPLLLAHRASLLASQWSQKPSDFGTLKDALIAMQSLCTAPGFESLAYAVRLEIWQTQFRPIFRAILFGFDDVQEISESIIAPLLKKPAWMKEFGRLALKTLSLLFQIEWNNDNLSKMNVFEPPLQVKRCNVEVETWPPVRDDFILKRLVQRSRRIDRSALDTHRVIVCVLLVSDDILNVGKCVPSCYECFEPHSLSNPISLYEISPEQKLAFVEDAIIARAQAYTGPTLESLDLGEIDTLAETWGLDMRNIRTLFFLAMYEFGKDRVVDELLTRSVSHIDVQRFVQDGVDIVCRRLNDLIHAKRSRPPNLRDAIGLLDADLCEWIRDRAEQSRPLVVFSDLQVPIAQTHLYSLRLLSLSRGTNDESDKRIKIHSIIVLSGTLVKAMETEETH